MWNPYDFSGKNIIITGATSGIGKAVAIKLAEQGARVFMLARNRDTLMSTFSNLPGEGHGFYEKDFSEPAGYKEIFDDIVSTSGKINGLVHCAGIAKTVPVNMLSKKTMDDSMTVNLYAFVEMVSLLSKKKYHDKASIVGISSIATQYPSKCQTVYAASKSALNAAVTAMAIELVEKGIRINTVMPGSTKTRMLRDAYANLTDEELEDLFRVQLLGLIEPEDIADVVLFLLSDASRMITGRAIYADAGTIPDLSRQ